MNPLMTQWLQRSLEEGYDPIEVAAAVARGVAAQTGLLRDSSGPDLLSCGNLLPP